MTTNTLRSLTLVALGVCGLGATLPSYAATTASISASSMYLWRGQSISGSGPAVSGDIAYSHDSGFYASFWTSSEGLTGHETDLNIGFTKRFGDIGFDVGVYEYLYPEKIDLDTTSATFGEPLDLMDSDASEAYVGGIFGPVSAKLFVNTETTDNMYITVDAAFGMFGVHAGFTKTEDSVADYNDFNVSVTPVSNLTFTVSKATGDAAEGNEDPLFAVSYKMPFEVK